jgi:hypothetical protein
VYLSINLSLQNHQILTSLPPLPEGGEIEERAIVHDDPQESTPLESEVAASNKTAASSEKETESEASESARSPPSAVSPSNKRKKGEVEDSGTSKPPGSHVEETSPEEEGGLCPYDDAIISS